MATIEAERAVRLAVVRRLEAAGFRAFPATETTFDGTWALRLTAGFDAKRLNSVNPLDPSDHRDIAGRIARAADRFRAFGRPLLFRQSPLAPPALIDHLDAGGWTRFAESIVFTADLAALDLSDALDRIPIHDVERYIDASLSVHERPDAVRGALAAIFAAIRPPSGFFLQQDAGGAALAVAMAIQDDDLAGVLDVAVARSARGQGLGRDIVRTALRYALLKGARTGWLQVEADNVAGLALYRSLGFAQAYRYIYRAPPA